MLLSIALWLPVQLSANDAELLRLCLDAHQACEKQLVDLKDLRTAEKALRQVALDQRNSAYELAENSQRGSSFALPLVAGVSIGLVGGIALTHLVSLIKTSGR